MCFFSENDVIKPFYYKKYWKEYLFLNFFFFFALMYIILTLWQLQHNCRLQIFKLENLKIISIKIMRLFVYLFVCLFFFPVLLKGFAFAQVESTILNILIALGLQWFNLCPLTSATPLCIWNTKDVFRHLPTCGFSNSPWVQQPHVLLRCHGYSMHSSPLKKCRLIWFRIE